MSAVQARVHYTMKQEFKLLAGIIRDNTPVSYDYQPDIGQAAAKQSDYDQVDVIPVSDPNASTLAQRVVQYQAVMQLAQSAPQIYNLPLLHRQMIETLGIKNADKLVPTNDDMKPMDPVSENMAVLMGKPVKAFLYQDHEAHLQVHMSAMQDPKIAAMVGQNPQAQAIQAAAAAHIMEHVAFQYRKEIEKQLGAALPPPPDFEGEDDDVGRLPPEIEVQLSQMAAQAAARLLQKDQAEVQAQQAQEQMQDPLVQMQQMDLQIKKQLADIKAQELQIDSQIKQAELELRAREVQARIENERTKNVTDAANRADDLNLREAQARAQTQLEALRLQIEAADMADAVRVKELQQQLNAVRLQLDAANMADQGAIREAEVGLKQQQMAAMQPAEEPEPNEDEEEAT